jgi:hypothetical protein
VSTPPKDQSASPTRIDKLRGIASEGEIYDGIDLREVFDRLVRGLPQMLGVTALGLAIGAVIYFASNPFTSTTTSMRVTFAFDGFGKGEYPDRSKFQPEDIFAPDIIADAVKRLGYDNVDGLISSVQSGLTIEGLIPPSVVKERDRLRATGQAVEPYIADEYLVTLMLSRECPLNARQKSLLLNELVELFRERFQRTYAEMPLTFGNAFETLRNVDYSEYELVLNQEIKNIADFLRQQLDVDDEGASAGISKPSRTFRSRATNLSFSDLLEQTRLFEQIQLNQTLGVIYQNGLSQNRSAAITKMNYYLQTLGDQEQEAIEKEAVVDGLLSKAQERSQNYVLGIKSQAAQQNPGSPILDQGLIDSLLANDAYNFLVRRALDAGLAVKAIQANKSQVMERLKNMQSFLSRDDNNQGPMLKQVQASLIELQSAYNKLVSNIRITQTDYSKQQFADAVKVSMQPISESGYKQLEIGSAVGGLIGFVLSFGLSFLGIYIDKVSGK